MSKVGKFVNWEEVNLADLDGKIVLDFSATWCPSCVQIKKDIENSLSDIPADVTIVLVDYDSNKDLRVKYGVTSQHTFVQVKNNGEKIKLWQGGKTLEDVLANIE
jgi:thiol-disulfide isomerase/thioredoxin